MVTAEDAPATSDALHQHVELEEDENEENEEIEEIDNPYHNPNMDDIAIINNADSDESENEREVEEGSQANGWVTFSNDADFGDFHSYLLLHY